ncbi:hypothetical protein RB595_006041 [Gaeumannomyces hyphopodioides]
MKVNAPAALLALAGLVAAEVPQEHSHEALIRAVKIELEKNNPLAIADPVFALLGNAAAAEGAPNVAAADLDCLQQITADQAFTNAKAEGSVDGQVTALLYAALERNTLTVGEASKVCSTVTATNPEIGAITRIQDPASAEGKAGNKKAILDLAVQIAKVGGDPLLATQAGTFAPGQIGDPTAAGNTCNDAEDAKGCIISQNLLVVEATDNEIQQAVAAAGNGNGNGNVNNGGAANNGTGNANNGQNKNKNKNNKNKNNNNANNGGAAADACNAAGGNNNSTGNAGNNNNNNNNNNNAGNNNAGAGNAANIQAFTGSLGGAPPAVTFDSGAQRPFTVNGNSFTTAQAALTRSCDIQNNQCFNAANGGQLTGGTQQCQQQQQECLASVATSAAAASKARRAVVTSGRRSSRY